MSWPEPILLACLFNVLSALVSPRAA